MATGPDPLHPPRPGANRQDVHRRPRRRPRGPASSPRSTPARSARRCAPWCPVFATDGSDRVVALVSVGITIASIDRQLRHDLVLIGDRGAAGARRSGWPAPGWSAAGCGGRPTGWARREITRMYEYYTAVLQRGPRGAAAARHRRPGAAGQRRGAPAARPARRRGRPAARRPRPGARRWSRRRSAGPPRPTTSTWPATGCWWSAPPPPPGRARTSAPWSPCATTPSCARSPASSTWSAASASRCAPRTTRRPTGCTRWCRSSSWAGSRRPSTSPPRSSRSPSCSPTRSSARSATRWSRRCCSARPPRPPSAASSSRIEGDPARRATYRPRDLVTVLGNLVDNAFDARRPAAADVRRVRVALGGDRGRGRRLGRATAARASTTTRSPTRSSGAGPPRRPERPAAASGWPWSPRSPAGTAATSRSAAPSSGGAGSR